MSSKFQWRCGPHTPRHLLRDSGEDNLPPDRRPGPAIGKGWQWWQKTPDLTKGQDIPKWTRPCPRGTSAWTSGKNFSRPTGMRCKTSTSPSTQNCPWVPSFPKKGTWKQKKLMDVSIQKRANLQVQKWECKKWRGYMQNGYSTVQYNMGWSGTMNTLRPQTLRLVILHSLRLQTLPLEKRVVFLTLRKSVLEAKSQNLTKSTISPPSIPFESIFHIKPTSFILHSCIIHT